MPKPKTQIEGNVYIVGDDIDTDQIIPAEHLNLLPNRPEERKLLGGFALSGLPDSYAPFIPKGEYTTPYSIIMAGKNFGCGSSREHAPIALSTCGVLAVVAESYSRIFFRNVINTGLLYPLETQTSIRHLFEVGDRVLLQIPEKILVVQKPRKNQETRYHLESLGDAEKIIQEGGIFAYAKKYGMN